MKAWTTWVGLLRGSDNVLLPAAHQYQYVLHIGWAVVLAWVVYWIASRLGCWAFRKPKPRSARRWAAVLAACVSGLTLLPGELSPAFWLGLAFQAPSLMAVTCSAYLLAKEIWDTGPRSLWAAPLQPVPWSLYWLVLGAVWGTVLLADTFALLPVPLYALGFGPMAATMVFAWVSVPLAFAGLRGRDASMWLAPVVVAVFVLTRWPTGNVWDAVLDPLLWGLICIALVRRLIWGR